MRDMPRHPSLYQINTRPWLNCLSRQAGHPVGLDAVPDEEIDGWAERGFDWIWLLSVWTTGAAGRAVSRNHPEWRDEFRRALPDLSEADICGSGFAIADYTVSRILGGPRALASLRRRLAERGMRLMLDFVPNHMAPDHRWVRQHPDFFIAGTEENLRDAPGNYVRLALAEGERIFAHGRDPNFPGWPDTLQLDYGNPALRQAMSDELLAIAGQCDGVRCDMAMLVLPEVFARTWGIATEPFWPEAIERTRTAHPGFAFMAEVYWDMEWNLQQQGFDHCYDKRLYDHLHAGRAQAVHDHLGADIGYQRKLARFLENHDEPRAASRFPPGMHEAAAVATYFAPGLRFFHQGQLTGARTRIPTHLCRGPIDPGSPDIAGFYERLFRVLRLDILRDGSWRRLDPEPAWPGNPTFGNLLAGFWEDAAGRQIAVIVNFTDTRGQCRVRLPVCVADGPFALADLMGSEKYEREASELCDPGLFVELGPWRYNVFDLMKL